MTDQDDLARLRALRDTLTRADTNGHGLWFMLRERFPEPGSLIGTADDVRTALDLAYETGYEDGESSRGADNTLEVDRLRELLGRLEWASSCTEEPACPACDGWKDSGHAADCWLAAELRPLETQKTRYPSGEE